MSASFRQVIVSMYLKYNVSMYRISFDFTKQANTYDRDIFNKN